MREAAKIVEEYLRLHMIPDPDSARQFCAPNLEIRFTGNRLMHDPAEATAFNRARYKWVKKKFGPTHVAEGASDEETVVYQTGTLYGEWLDGTPFEGNRYVDRYYVSHSALSFQTSIFTILPWLTT